MTSNELHPGRLFIGSCIALIATSVAFSTIGAIMGTLKQEFLLSNLQVGWIGGAALWGFAVSQLIFAPLCDTLGMRFLLRLAFVGHVAGTVIMFFAGGFVMLFAGALVIAMANGLVEAACNPLVATLFPDNKTTKLNRFHVWFPGGIVLGGLAAYFLAMIGITSWQVVLALILIPTVVYGFMMLTETFPETEGVKAGVSMGEMFKSTLAHPLMLLMLAMMAITASVELGPNRWIPSVLESGGIPGILVLVWISGLMAVLRFFAGPVVHKLSPTGILLASSVISAIGLYWLSYSETVMMAFAAATVFAIGVCYFWPTMLGFVSERIPKSGAFGLGLMGAVGMAVVGLVTAPLMGEIADEYAHEQLPQQVVVSLLTDVAMQFPALADNAGGSLGQDITAAASGAADVVAAFNASGELEAGVTANSLRAIISSGADSPLVESAGAVLGPADNYGGRMSFRYIVPFCLILVLVFGGLFWQDKKAGGYQAKRLTTE